MQYDKYNPEYYGYTLGQNIVPYINQIIQDIGEVHITEGTHIVGRNDRNWNQGNPWADNTIGWGWTRKDDVKIIGAGFDKTTLKYIDNVQSQYLFDQKNDVYILMLQTKYDVECNNTYIEGITWDGNHSNNSDSTSFAIRLRGQNTTVTKCRFINFGVGNAQKSECFQLGLGPIVPNGKGPTVTYNVFEQLANKSNSPAGYVPENTCIAVGGYQTTIKGNIFRNCIFDRKTQQSPIHGITFGGCKDSIITENVFDNFQGFCIYTDSWQSENVTINNNIANNVWSFIDLSNQHWDNPDQITLFRNFDISNNTVTLAIGEITHEWDVAGYPSRFVGYSYDPTIDRTKYPGFENVHVHDNKVTLGYLYKDGTYQESFKTACYYGNAVGNDKINVENNTFVSTIPVPPAKLSFFGKILAFFKKLFGIK